jgi:hypothetical protein
MWQPPPHLINCAEIELQAELEEKALDDARLRRSSLFAARDAAIAVRAQVEAELLHAENSLTEVKSSTQAARSGVHQVCFSAFMTGVLDVVMQLQLRENISTIQKESEAQQQLLKELQVGSCQHFLWCKVVIRLRAGPERGSRGCSVGRGFATASR